MKSGTATLLCPADDLTGHHAKYVHDRSKSVTHAVTQNYIYIPLFCPYRVLMVDIFIIFRVQHFFGYKLWLFHVNSDIFIIFRVHQVKLQKVPLNGNKNNQTSTLRGAQRVEKVY